MKQQCQNPGSFKFTWPGKDEDYICSSHLPNLLIIANAMGLYIQIRPNLEEEQRQCGQILIVREARKEAGEAE